ncbi:MAG: lysozyme, partial [Clostridia bacterium]|nr:lysozyme [Clostridia bacterium]
MKKKLTVLLIILGILVLGVLSAIALYHMVWNGVILLNNPSKRKYPVRGVDVSHYQGEIDWNVLSGEDI